MQFYVFPVKFCQRDILQLSPKLTDVFQNINMFITCLGEVLQNPTVCSLMLFSPLHHSVSLTLSLSISRSVLLVIFQVDLG